MRIYVRCAAVAGNTSCFRTDIYIFVITPFKSCFDCKFCRIRWGLCTTAGASNVWIMNTNSFFDRCEKC